MCASWLKSKRVPTGVGLSTLRRSQGCVSQFDLFFSSMRDTVTLVHLFDSAANVGTLMCCLNIVKEHGEGAGRIEKHHERSEFEQNCFKIFVQSRE